jgi:hypothetical protein
MDNLQIRYLDISWYDLTYESDKEVIEKLIIA